jgi:hypothetical protein
MGEDARAYIGAETVQRSFVGNLRFAKLPLPQDDIF